MKTKRVKIIVLSILFVLSSISAFYGTRLSLPIVTYYGRGTLNTLPATLTFALPLFSFIVLWRYANTDTIATRWKTNLIYAITMIVIPLFNLLLILINLYLFFGWNFVVGTMTPAYPLDLFILNLVFLSIGGASLFFALANKNRRLDKNTEGRKRTLERYHVLSAFFICFAAYFFGEAIFGINNLIDNYIDPNIVFTIPVYLAFLLLTVQGVIFAIYTNSPEDKKIKRGLIGLLVLLGLTFVIFGWVGIGLLVNPYYFSESMQWEFAIGYTIKVPFGLIIIGLWVIIPSIVALIRMIKMIKLKALNHE
ncbi:MAG: hypothetical protein VB015_03495 [Erysipelotrichaceae bacterium]|nr:hypothetical protein [Erysipelotrichaceae bacterium]